MSARRMPDGLLRPEAADLFEGIKAAQDLGLDPHDIHQRDLSALGRAVADQRWAGYDGPVYEPGQEPELSPEARAAMRQVRDQHRLDHALVQVQARRAWCRERGHHHAVNESCDWFEQDQAQVPHPGQAQDQDQDQDQV